MKRLAVYMYEGRGDRDPVTVRVPLSWISMLAGLLPHMVVQQLEARDVDIDGLIEQAGTAAPGILCEIEDGADRIVIAVEDDRRRTET